MSRDDFVKALQEKEVGAGVYYPRALHTYPHVAKFGYSVGDFPEAEKAAAEVVSLPVHPHVSPADIDTIIKTIKEIAHV
jgi:dTDP-4-amino-4,6-dideoxygalactose transaminase